MNKKIIGILVCVLFFGAIVVPSISGNIEKFIILKNTSDNCRYKDLHNIPEIISLSSGWSEQDKLLASDGEEGEYFARSLSIYGDYAIIGIPLDDDNGHDSGSAYIFKLDGDSWIQQAKLLPSDGEADDLFGGSVSIFGEYAIIGARQWDAHNKFNMGAVYVFRHVGGTDWIEQQILEPVDGFSNDEFGSSVSLYGEYALIGSPKDDDYAPGSGSAYIFKRTGSSWTQYSKLLPLDGGSNGDYFGESVSLYNHSALIAKKLDDENGLNSGSAYVFRLEGASWIQEAKILPSDGEPSNVFGFSVSIYGDYALIGSDDDENGPESGSAYVFKRDGLNWVEEAKLLTSDGNAEDNFGCSVSIFGDYALIGAEGDDDLGSNSGSVYVFKRDDTSWTEEDKLTASDTEGYDHFGYTVSLFGDYALIGAPSDDDNGAGSGSAYVFIRTSDIPPDLKIDGLSPIDLNVTDAEGRFINKNSSTIPYATYTEEDLDGDGELDDRVLIPDAIDGLYNIEVIPEPDAEPTDTYSLNTTLKDVIYNLAKDVMIQDIPPEGYNLSWPDKPSTPDGPSNGKVGNTYTYTSSTSDPDGDDILYLFDWGDGTDSGWIGTGEASHSWSKRSNYNIKVKAKDTHGFESRWSDPLTVTIPRNKATSYIWYQWLFERCPLLERLLNLLIK
jgi:hypothetical protein